ncbi:MAG: efflux RND transporter periplasmic adaptor subunit [Muribaculaceae bacterium]|nr:efflux RND transporter periplasmic adaptor subunit [Muribaculaceae bacterium]
MKNISVICISALCLGLGSCGHSHSGHNEHDHDHDHDHEHEATESAVHEHAEGEIVVEPEIARRFGMKTDTVRVGACMESIKAAGTFVSSSSSIANVAAPLAGTVRYPQSITVGSKVSRGATVATVRPDAVEGNNANAMARANMLAAKREMDRLKPLYDDRLVTAAEYNAAVAAYEAAKAAYSPGASGTVHAPISGVVTSVDVANGSFADAGSILMQISGGGDLTLKVDVPHSSFTGARNASDANVILADGRVIRLGDVGARRISAAESGATEAGSFVAVYFSVPAEAGIAPGSTAEVYLLGQNTGNGISVPRSALSEQQGSFFVYEKTGDHSYRRLPVTIGGSDGVNTVVTSGLGGGEIIVTEAVTTVRLAENSGAIPEGHNHSH